MFFPSKQVHSKYSITQYFFAKLQSLFFYSFCQLICLLYPQQSWSSVVFCPEYCSDRLCLVHVTQVKVLLKWRLKLIVMMSLNIPIMTSQVFGFSDVVFSTVISVYIGGIR